MRPFLGVLFVVSTFAGTSAFATGEPFCGTSYRWDSFGRGLEAGIKGGDQRPKLVDQVCYDLGAKKGRESVKEVGVKDCQTDFDRGFAEGFKNSHTGTWEVCFTDGYNAGLALLHVGAREGDSTLVGVGCVSEYRRGIADYRGALVQMPELDPVLMECYQQGYFDGPLFPSSS